MTPGEQARRPRGKRSAAQRLAVVFLPCATRPLCRHESVTQIELARRLAIVNGCEFGGEFDPARHQAGTVYVVPSDTLPGLARAQALGIHREDDLFGGVVPFPFVATKTITHALPAADSLAPEGWCPGFARRVAGVVLPGWSAFTAHDARLAGVRLLAHGAVRIKRAGGIGGSGQSVAGNLAELDAEIHALVADDTLREGVVLERNLSEVATLSVGQVRVPGLTASYFGTQRLTPNNRGQEVYGGSSLTLVRGDYERLLELPMPSGVRTAIDQARTYHRAALASFAGMYASRCNYDVAQGIDSDGRWCSGVLEQSWRIGGASGAEIAALLAFRADPALQAVRASTTEIYAADPAVPPGAVVYFSGNDEQAGPITKYSETDAYVDP